MTISTRVAMTGRALSTDLRLIEGAVPFLRDDHDQDLQPPANGTEDCFPTVIARCGTVRAVQAAMTTARAHGLTVAVSGSERDDRRHCPGGALARGELVIDLSAMRHVAVDPVTGIATIAGGATVKEVVAAAAAHGFVPVTGTCGAMKMSGIMSDGGYGPLLGRYGLAADNVIEAEIVLKNGRHVVANAERDDDVFRALRGGGSELGVVVSLQVRLHALSSLLAGMIFYAWSEADLVLRGYSAMAAAAPDALTISAGIISTADGNPLLFIAPTWCGDKREGERVLSALQSFGNPLAAIAGPLSYADLLALRDPYIAKCARFSIWRRCIPKLTDRVVSALIVAADAKTSPQSAIMLHHVHGAATRRHSQAAALGAPQQYFLMEAVASSESATNDQAAGHRLWAENLPDMPAPIGGRTTLFERDDQN